MLSWDGWCLTMLWGWIPTFYTHSCSTYWDAASHHREVSVSLQCLWCLHFTWKPQERFENLSLACVGSNISLSHAHIHMPLETGWIIFLCVPALTITFFYGSTVRLRYFIARLSSTAVWLMCPEPSAVADICYLLWKTWKAQAVGKSMTCKNGALSMLNFVLCLWRPR